jgi:uncharacterized protein (TIGR03435 family)
MNVMVWSKTLLAVALGTGIVAAQTFEVASVKPNDSQDRGGTTNVPLGPSGAFTPTHGYFSATNYPLMTYILFAYKINGNQFPFLRSQLPDWVNSDKFDIQARAPGEPTKDEMRAMMRALLAERFQLKIHEETREIPVLAIVLAKPGKFGPNFRPHPADAQCNTVLLPQGRTSALTAPSPKDMIDGGFPVFCGGLLQLEPSVPGRWHYGGRDLTLEFLSNSLSSMSQLGRPMVDKTGLTGKFDFHLEWTPEGRGPAPDNPGPTFEAAMREQLGLKLESTKAPMPVLVVDKIEHLTGN